MVAEDLQRQLFDAFHVELRYRYDAHEVLVRMCADDHGDGHWALTCRWEIHPDGHPEVAGLIAWLAARRHKNGPFFGYQRWYEADEPELLSPRRESCVACRDGATAVLG